MAHQGIDVDVLENVLLHITCLEIWADGTEVDVHIGEERIEAMRTRRLVVFLTDYPTQVGVEDDLVEAGDEVGHTDVEAVESGSA